jgi:hypothetical protein
MGCLCLRIAVSSLQEFREKFAHHGELEVEWVAFVYELPCPVCKNFAKNSLTMVSWKLNGLPLSTNCRAQSARILRKIRSPW